MVTQLELKAKTLYDTDYNLWVLETVKLLQEGNFNKIDLENLIEEVLDLSERKRHKIESLLTRLFEYLLKLKYWESEREYNQNHWKKEIFNFRTQLKKELKVSPSLKRHLLEVFEESYQYARKMVSLNSGLSLNMFPSSPIANVEQLLDEDWLP
jgi:hypothetical protein